MLRLRELRDVEKRNKREGRGICTEKLRKKPFQIERYARESKITKPEEEEEEEEQEEEEKEEASSDDIPYFPKIDLRKSEDSWLELYRGARRHTY